MWILSERRFIYDYSFNRNVQDGHGGVAEVL